MFRRAWVASFAIATALQLAAVCSARADDSETNDVARAEAFASSAFDAYARGEYSKAVGLYGSAFDASPSPDILYNIARIYDTKLKNRALAIEYYLRYSQDPAADAERLQMATDRLLALREQERQAQRAREPSPPKPAPAIVPSVPSAPSVTKVAPAELPEQNPYAASHTLPIYERGLTDYELAGFIIGSVGIASIAVGVGFGLAAKSDADAVHDLCSGNACGSQRGVDIAERGSNLALVSTVSFVAGALLIAGGAGLLLFGPHGTEHQDTPRAQLVPWADHHGAGLQLASSF